MLVLVGVYDVGFLGSFVCVVGYNMWKWFMCFELFILLVWEWVLVMRLSCVCSCCL